MVWDDALDAKNDAARASLADALKKTVTLTKGDYKDVQGGPDGEKAASSSTEKGITTAGELKELEKRKLVTTRLEAEDKKGEDGKKAGKSSDSGTNEGGKGEAPAEKEVKKTDLESEDKTGEDGKEAGKASESGTNEGGKGEAPAEKEVKKTDLESEDKTGEDGKAAGEASESGTNEGASGEAPGEKEVTTTTLESEDKTGESGEAAAAGEGGEVAATEGSEATNESSPGGTTTSGTAGQNDDGIKIWDIGFNFKVEIDGITVGSFQQFSGIKWETKVQEVREGGRNTHAVKLMGPSSYTDVSLAKGYMSSNAELLQMRKDMLDESKAFDRISMSLIVCNDAGEEVGRYNFFEVWPTSWEGPTFDSKQGALAIEKVKFAFSTFEYEPS